MRLLHLFHVGEGPTGSDDGRIGRQLDVTHPEDIVPLCRGRDVSCDPDIFPRTNSTKKLILLLPGYAGPKAEQDRFRT